MFKIMRLLAALLSVALVAAACSSDGSDTETGDDSTTTEASTDDTEAPTDDTEAPADDTTTTEAPTDDTEASTDDTEADDDDAMADGASIVVSAVSFTDSTVTIRNDGSEAVDFTGYFTCNRPAYGEMPAGTLEPGATLDVDVSSLDIRASGGEFGLYKSRSFDSPADIVAYVQWGAAGNGRESVAVEAGLIADDEFVDNGGEDFTVG